MINLHHIDCMDFMRGLRDKAYELAIVDPPYGIGHSMIAAKQSGTQYGKSAAPKTTYKYSEWDKNIPQEEYFHELFRVSKDQIIWGANYMTIYLPPSMGWIFWDKDNSGNYSDGELAFTSFCRGLQKIKITWNGMIQHDMLHKESRIHPTQKPVALYKWLLKNYAKPGDRVLDTHGGSMSIAIACYDLGFDLDLCELDKDYFQAGQKRLDDHIAKYAPASDRPVTNKGQVKLF
jgi:site-specific DNA-methyltransferase (adenine-specific)